MSHTRTLKMEKLGKVNPALVTMAMRSLAQKYGAKVVTRIRSYMGSGIAVHAGIQGGRIKYGMGVTIGADGRAEFIGDDYASDVSMDTLQQEFQTQHYPTAAARAAFKRMGFTPKTKMTAKGLVTVGVR